MDFRHSGSFPFLSSPSPLIELGHLGERCKLPQRVLAEPGHQTHFEVKVKHFRILMSCLVPAASWDIAIVIL